MIAYTCSQVEFLTTYYGNYTVCLEKGDKLNIGNTMNDSKVNISDITADNATFLINDSSGTILRKKISSDMNQVSDEEHDMTAHGGDKQTDCLDHLLNLDIHGEKKVCHCLLFHRHLLRYEYSTVSRKMFSLSYQIILL